MNNIDKLIKKLQEAKEELNKNMNCAPGTSTNMRKEELEKDAANPKLAPKDIKVKELQGKIDAGTYKPDASKIANKMVKEEAMMMGEGCLMSDMKVSKNGQWNMKKGAFKELESKLEHEGKSKESAGAIAYSVGEKKYGKAGMEHKAEEAKKSEDGMEKSVYNAGTHPMKGRESKTGNFPSYEYDSSAPHEENIKQAKAHFEKHPHIKLNDAQLEAHVKQAKTKA